VAYKAGIVQSGNGTGYVDVLLEMDREDALKASRLAATKGRK
jgi:hypothetical protein